MAVIKQKSKQTDYNPEQSADQPERRQTRHDGAGTPGVATALALLPGKTYDWQVQTQARGARLHNR
jgi:hypothetical protein